MLTKDELLELIQDIESSRAERTVSVNDTDKFCEAVCAFANDMPDSKQNGYLLVGVHDDGRLSGLKATDSLLKNLAAIRFDRDYRSTGPTMFYQYADRIELLNSGGLYGRVNREYFPDENDYRKRAEKDAERAENAAERAEKVKAWVLNMIPSGVRLDARSNMASVMAGIGMDKKITTEGLVRLTGLSDRGVRKTVSALKAFGLLVRVGSDRAGHWEVVGFEP